jgi:hypothetical protein
LKPTPGGFDAAARVQEPAAVPMDRLTWPARPARRSTVDAGRGRLKTTNLPGEPAMKRTVAVFGLLLLMSQTGCITTAVIVGSAVAFGAIGSEKGAVSMNYMADIDKTFDATQDQLKALGQTPDPKKTDARGSQRELKAGPYDIVVKEMKKDVGTRVSVKADTSKPAEVERARGLLTAIAEQLGQRREVDRDYRADLKKTWDAAHEQLKAMKLKPSEHGTQLGVDKGAIRLENAWIDLERLADGTRVKIDFTTDAPAEGLEKSRQFLDGVARRVGEKATGKTTPSG